MSLEQYQRAVNDLDKDIANLEKKKAAVDKKAADEEKRAANVSISKNASLSTIQSKHRQIETHKSNARKAFSESADLSQKIADKRKKRNEASLRLQKEEENERKKQDRINKRTKENYEQRIRELQMQVSYAQTIPHNDEVCTDPCITEYDVFVSHAWEDKEEFADEFVKALEGLDITVWYDTHRMKWGDSMREKIDEGLRKSRFGVAILSPNYIAEGKYWTKAELDGLFQLESINGKTLLPIWHNLTKKEVIAYSPIIASKLAMTTATMTPLEIAEALKTLLEDNSTVVN